MARWMVMFLRRPGGQSQFAAALWQPASELDAIRAAQDAILTDPGADHCVPALAAGAGMSLRNFTRVFTRELGTTPARYVERVRVEAACRLLETTALDRRRRGPPLRLRHGRDPASVVPAHARHPTHRLPASLRARRLTRRSIRHADRCRAVRPADRARRHRALRGPPAAARRRGHLRRPPQGRGADRERLPRPDRRRHLRRGPPSGRDRRPGRHRDPGPARRRTTPLAGSARPTRRPGTRRRSARARWCSAPPGLLQGLTATTYWSVLEELRRFGAEPTSERVVEHLDQRIITAAGVSSGIDMALRLSELLFDDIAARAMQLMIEYDPQPPFDSGAMHKADDDGHHPGDRVRAVQAVEADAERRPWHAHHGRCALRCSVGRSPLALRTHVRIVWPNARRRHHPRRADLVVHGRGARGLRRRVAGEVCNGGVGALAAIGRGAAAAPLGGGGAGGLPDGRRPGCGVLAGVAGRRASGCGPARAGAGRAASRTCPPCAPAWRTVGCRGRRRPSSDGPLALTRSSSQHSSRQRRIRPSRRSRGR